LTETDRAAGVDLSDEERRQEKARQDKEHVDTDETAGQGVRPQVVDDHGGDSYPTESVEAWYVNERGPWAIIHLSTILRR
jgi:hypothetical protein